MTSSPLVSALLAAGLLTAGVGVVQPTSPGSGPAATAVQQRVPPPGPQRDAPAPVEELLVPADSVLGLQLQTPVSTTSIALEEPVAARVTRDVMVGGRIAVPTGSRALGSVSLLQQGADKDKDKDQEPPRLALRFHALELPDGERVEISTEPVVRDARRRAPRLARVGGGAAGGAVVGAILGGGRGAAIGGVLGAAGAAATAPGREDEVEMPVGTVLSVRTLEAFRVTRRPLP
jgi:hypothetical protein